MVDGKVGKERRGKRLCDAGTGEGCLIRRTGRSRQVRVKCLP